MSLNKYQDKTVNFSDKNSQPPKLPEKRPVAARSGPTENFDDFFSNSLANRDDFMRDPFAEMQKRFDQLMPFSMDKFPMDSMLANFDSKNLPAGGKSYFHSSIQTFDDKGKKYEKTHSIARSGDLKEERKTEEDRDEELRKMAIGQYSTVCKYFI